MRDYEVYLTSLSSIPENQQQPQSFAIQQAVRILTEANVVDILGRQSGPEANTDQGESTDLSLGQFIKSTRRALHPPISQEGLARRAGLSASWEQQLEQDRPKIKPSVEALCRLAIAMNLDNERAEEFVSAYGEIDKGIALATAQFMLPGFRQQFAEQGQLSRLRK